MESDQISSNTSENEMNFARITIEERTSVLLETIEAIENSLEQSSSREINRRFEELGFLAKEDRIPSYPNPPARRLLNILFHPLLRDMTPKLNYTVDYFVAILLQQAIESQNQDAGYLNQVNVCNNYNVLSHLEGVVTSEHYPRLIEIVSMRRPEMNTASANAITILTKANYRFLGKQLRGLYISGANLSGGNFTGTDFSRSKMKGVNLRKCTLVMTNLSRCDLMGVKLEDAIKTQL